MKITWIGHSCFKIEKEGYSLVIDPYNDESVPGLNSVRERANMVLCSHEHQDHNSRSSVVTENVETENPFRIECIETFHDQSWGKARGNNQIHIIDDGEYKIAHLGDLGCKLAEEQREKLKYIDVMLIPVGGYYTIDGKQAAELVMDLKPRIVIPMHYRDDIAGYGFDEISTVADFTENLDSVMTIPASEIEAEHEFPAQVVVMQPHNMK